MTASPISLSASMPAGGALGSTCLQAFGYTYSLEPEMSSAKYQGATAA